MDGVELIRNYIDYRCLDDRNYPCWLFGLPTFRIQLGQDHHRRELRRSGHLVHNYWPYQSNHGYSRNSSSYAAAVSTSDGIV
jgi:hypothetical protein